MRRVLIIVLISSQMANRVSGGGMKSVDWRKFMEAPISPALEGQYRTQENGNKIVESSAYLLNMTD
jgi:hypothetical protein